MTNPPPPPPANSPAAPATTAPPLQFDRADFTTPAAQSCVACKRPVLGAYYTTNNKVVCAPCRDAYLASTTGGSPFPRLAQATLFGLGASLAGAIVWFAIRKLLHMQIGLIAIAVGYMVGISVRKGSGARGGAGYQILAVLLTYAAIGGQWVPDIYTALRDDPGYTPLSLTVDVVYNAVTYPVRAGASSIIGLLIIGFALWEAWKLNRKRTVTFTGPHAIAPTATPATPRT